MNQFAGFELLESLQKTLAEKGLVKPTEIQERAMPLLLQGRSLVGVAETGSGKTLAYALPILHRLKTREIQGDPVTEAGEPRAAVIVPTRELGEQVARAFKLFTHETRLRVRTVLGGTGFDVAKRNIAGPFEVLVATPGRLVQLMDRELVSLSQVRTLVLDEADQMLDQGFLPDATRIVKACPAQAQMALFSATVTPAVQSLMNELFREAAVIRSRGSHKVVDSLTTLNRTVQHGRRLPVLETVLQARVTGGTLIFTNTREQCDTLFEELRAKGKNCAIYRGEMDKVERRANLRAFRDGEIDILISTDLGSRGLDIDRVGRVINYHLPEQVENYLHRVGRTARAGRPGTVINLVTERDRPLLKKLEESRAALNSTEPKKH